MSATDIIAFNSNDWDSIKDTICKINRTGAMQFGRTSEGETIIFDVGRNESGDYLITEVFQNNGWVRRNCYYPNDCVIDETYKKC